MSHNSMHKSLVLSDVPPFLHDLWYIVYGYNVSVHGADLDTL